MDLLVLHRVDHQRKDQDLQAAGFRVAIILATQDVEVNLTVMLREVQIWASVLPRNHKPSSPVVQASLVEISH